MTYWVRETPVETAEDALRAYEQWASDLIAAYSKLSFWQLSARYKIMRELGMVRLWILATALTIGLSHE